jgi:release factor glutamine methyltransferase
MTQIREALSVAVKQLGAKDITSARLDAELLMSHVTGHDRPWVLAHDDDFLTDTQSKAFKDLVQRRAGREPLVHLTGGREFYGLDMLVTPDVLTPRVETEQMVDWAIKYAPKNSDLIDIGTGSGAIAIAIAKHRPDLTVSATDVSSRELQVATQNATRHNTKIELIESDLWSNISGKYQTVVANLPYLNSDADLMPEVQREPAVALFGGPDGLDLYRKFFHDLPGHLSSRGYVFVESDPWQHEALISQAAAANLSPIEKGYFILGFQINK